MIALDTSAIMAILLDEPEADAMIDIIGDTDRIVISAATVAETLIVANRRGIGADAERLLDGLGLEIIAVTAAARRVAHAYTKWGKGVHRAALNYGDCFAYDVAREQHCPLLFVGDDFARTDIARAYAG